MSKSVQPLVRELGVLACLLIAFGFCVPPVPSEPSALHFKWQPVAFAAGFFGIATAIDRWNTGDSRLLLGVRVFSRAALVGAFAALIQWCVTRYNHF